ncbi:unnamed protein product [Rangifer tarandus platyrhynchus]|uniref:Uncharacterized protein n=3 Tax=Rangifer tarandus platyrhynchus TaxID=3082113 RepID=A0AC59ZAT7_RANTA|nr:unnamed protein product [Rangifer tarandus platyrhynchus]CAI9704870.1 unnamed protein product [Rangifer tarandus platyrhynchus]
MWAVLAAHGHPPAGGRGVSRNGYPLSSRAAVGQGLALARGQLEGSVSRALCGSLRPVVGGMWGFTLGRAGSRDCGSRSPFQTLECPSLDVLALRGPREPAPVLEGSSWSWALPWDDGPSGEEGPGGASVGALGSGMQGVPRPPPGWPPCPE